MKLTASKLSRGALASADSGKRIPRYGRSNVGALVGCALVVIGRVGFGGVGFGGVGVGRVGASGIGVGVGTGKGTGSCKSGKGESTDDFELHIVCFLL